MRPRVSKAVHEKHPLTVGQLQQIPLQCFLRPLWPDRIGDECMPDMWLCAGNHAGFQSRQLVRRAKHKSESTLAQPPNDAVAQGSRDARRETFYSTCDNL